MPDRFSSRPPARPDQAHGLRTLFGGHRQRFVPLVHNPLVAGTGVVMERICAVATLLDRCTLVVDAADSASSPHELAAVDLAACVERLSASVSYLAARGLPMRYLDSRATMVGFLDQLRQALPQADLVLLHAGASDLRRIFAGRTPHPVLLAADRPDSLTQAYASMKLLSQRLGALSYDLIIAADVPPRRARRMADRLGECADHFLGSALRHSAVVDPLAPVRSALPAALKRLVVAQVEAEDDDPPALSDRPNTAGRLAPRAPSAGRAN